MPHYWPARTALAGTVLENVRAEGWGAVMKRVLSIAAVLACALQFGAPSTIAQSPPAPVPDGPLKYLTTSFVTGDVVVGGTSLFRKGVNGFATQNINISGVPAGAEILSAYL